MWCGTGQCLKVVKEVSLGDTSDFCIFIILLLGQGRMKNLLKSHCGMFNISIFIKKKKQLNSHNDEPDLFVRSSDWQSLQDLLVLCLCQ